MFEFRYALIRYVPDALRMEPINIGIVLQGRDRIDFRLNTQASKKGVIDTDTFKRWRAFLKEEVRGKPIPLFQPEKSSVRFLTHLQQLCEKTVLLSNPFIVSNERDAFDEVLESLYKRLVAAPPSEAAGSPDRPTGVFRRIAEERRFEQRGMKRHAHVLLNEKPLWIAYRQVMNGDLIAFDKIEVANRIGATANEIERIPTVAERLPAFTKANIAGKRTRYALLADQLEVPFSGQSQEDFKAMQDDFRKAIDLIEAQGGTIILTKSEVENFCEELDHKLPAPLSAATSN